MNSVCESQILSIIVLSISGILGSNGSTHDVNFSPAESVGFIFPKRLASNSSIKPIFGEEQGKRKTAFRTIGCKSSLNKGKEGNLGEVFFQTMTC